MIVFLILCLVFFGLAYLAFTFVLKELRAITTAIDANTKAIATNLQLAANAEATQNLANNLAKYIEMRYFSVGGGDGGG